MNIINRSKKINIKHKFSKFSEYWSPKVLAEMNDYQFKIAKIKGEFIWHNHSETDEVFIVVVEPVDDPEIDTLPDIKRD